MYAVVRFKEDDSTSEVPAIWLHNNDSQCWWPPTRNVGFFIRSLTKPNESTWTKHDVVVETFCDSIEVARKKAEDSNYTETEEHGEGRSKKKRLCKKKAMVDYIINNSESDEESNRTLPPPPKFPKYSAPSKLPTQKEVQIPPATTLTPAVTLVSQEIVMHSPSTSYNSDRSNENNEENAAPSSPTSDNIGSSNENNEVSYVIAENGDVSFDLHAIFETSSSERTALDESSNRITSASATHSLINDKDLFVDLNSLPKTPGTKLLMRVYKLVTELNLKVEQLLSNQSAGVCKSRNFDEIARSLPIKNEEELLQLDKYLEDARKKNIFVSYLSTVGGNSAKDMVFRVLRRIFTEEFTVKCSWLGLRNNIKICDKTTIQCVKDGIQQNFQISEKEFEKLAGEWFRQGGQRLKRKKN